MNVVHENEVELLVACRWQLGVTAAGDVVNGSGQEQGSESCIGLRLTEQENGATELTDCADKDWDGDVGLNCSCETWRYKWWFCTRDVTEVCLVCAGSWSC